MTRADEPGAPDVWLPAHSASLEVKRLMPRDDPLEDLRPVFRNLRRAHHQIAGDGPAAALVVIPSAASFEQWRAADSPFRTTLRAWFAEPEFARVSAVTFAGAPRFQSSASARLYHYGNRAWSFLNPNATHPWPNDLPLLSDGPGAG